MYDAVSDDETKMAQSSSDEIKEYISMFGEQLMRSVLDVFRDNGVDSISYDKMIADLPSVGHYERFKRDSRELVKQVVEQDCLMNSFGVRFSAETKEFLWIAK